jgi:2-keto-4-pentenoate hydratase/2-oxohepta-3-ene-1,7-dioic acid hydratase in catechol pathway
MTQIRRRFTGTYTLQVETRPDSSASWKPVSHLVALGYESPYTAGWELRHAITYGARPGTPVLPFQPLSVRHFYGSEQAILEAAYAHMQRILPPVTSAWETFLGAARERLPSFSSQAHEDEIQTAYRLNNPLSVVPTKSPVSVPANARSLGFEPRLGFIISSELSDATPEEARAAIAAFVLTCEFSEQGGGEERHTVPVPATPPSSLAAQAVSAAVLVDSWQELLVAASVNGQVVGQARAADTSVDLGELLAAASVRQRLMPGEFFSINALAGAGHSQSLHPGDQLVIAAPRLGRIEHSIS